LWTIGGRFSSEDDLAMVIGEALEPGTLRRRKSADCEVLPNVTGLLHARLRGESPDDWHFSHFIASVLGEGYDSLPPIRARAGIVTSRKTASDLTVLGGDDRRALTSSCL
jgi:hypothetical protein